MSRPLSDQRLPHGVAVNVPAGRCVDGRLGGFDQPCRRSDHALDAVIAALNACAATPGRTTPPAAEQAAAARTEGWIALPTSNLADLTHDRPH